MRELLNGKKSYTGLIGLGLIFILQGLGLMDDLQTLVVAAGWDDVDLFTVLAAFFGSLVGIGFTHKLAKIQTNGGA